MQQQHRTQRRKPRLTVSRRYSSSFSGIDWGFDLLRDSSRQELTKVQQDVLMSSLGEDKEEWRRTVISQESNDAALSTETETTQKSKKGGHSTQNRPSILSALNSWRGSLLAPKQHETPMTPGRHDSLTLPERFVPLSDNSTNKDDDSMGVESTAAKRGNELQLQTAVDPAPLVTRRCSSLSQLDESDVDDDGFLHWNQTQGVDPDPAALVIRRCSSQLDESDVDDDGFLHWNDTQRSRK